MGNRFPVINTTSGMNRTLRLTLGGIGILLTFGVLVACTNEPPPPPANSAPVIVPGKPGEEASTIPPGQAGTIEQPPPNDADLTFMTDMIFHHAQAVEMAKLAPNRAASKDLKELADRIADVQGPEIDMMNRWLAAHGQLKIDPSAPGGHGHGDLPMLDMPGMATPEQMTELKAAKGDRFDTLFLQLMITHHQGALTMAETVQKGGVDVRVQEIADDVIATQSDEIDRMRGWLAG
jgi:uncharacterized protein (DUF305 family)